MQFLTLVTHLLKSEFPSLDVPYIRPARRHVGLQRLVPAPVQPLRVSLRGTSIIYPSGSVEVGAEPPVRLRNLAAARARPTSRAAEFGNTQPQLVIESGPKPVRKSTKKKPRVMGGSSLIYTGYSDPRLRRGRLK